MARKFKQEASDLMSRLCALANTTASDPNFLYKLRVKFGMAVSHSLDDNWTFCLHGAECRFTENGSGRELEVIVIHGDNFGVLDLYFFAEYIRQEVFSGKFVTPFWEDRTHLAELLSDLYSSGLLFKVDRNVSELNRNFSA